MTIFSFFVLLFLVTTIDAAFDSRKLRVGVGYLTFLVFVGMVVSATLSIHFVSFFFDMRNEIMGWIVVGLLGIIVLGIIALGVALVINGIVLVRAEGKAVAHLLSFALGLGILLYVLGGIFAAVSGYFELLVFLMILVFPLGWLGYGLVSFVVYSYVYLRLTRRWGSGVEAIIVLGAGVPDGEVRPLLAGRIRAGIAWQQREDQRGRHPVLVMSGGQGPDEPVPEAEAMAQWAINQGVAPERILCETRSTSTEENLRLSSALLRDLGVHGRVAVVTSGYHAFRAATVMRALGIRGYAIGAPTARYYVPSAMLREYVAILRDHLWLNIIGLSFASLPLVVFLFAS